MEQEFVRAFGKAALVHEIDPARALRFRHAGPSAHDGCNWYDIDQQIDYLSPIPTATRTPMHYLFRPGLTITGFTGYGSVATRRHDNAAMALLRRHSGASIFWHYTLLNPTSRSARRARRWPRPSDVSNRHRPRLYEFDGA